MSNLLTTYPDWKAPAQDGQILVWPQAVEIIARVRRDFARLAADDRVRIQHAPLHELRRSTRAFVNHPHDQPMIATGHQAELYHAGVWVKDVLINQVARVVGGQAFHFSVDTDGPKHLQVRWPHYSAPITDDPRLASVAWSALLAPPTPRHIDQLDRDLQSASFAFVPMLGEFFRSLRRLSLEPDELPTMLTNAQHALDWSLGLSHHALTIGGVLRCDGFLAFAHHVMSRADQFASDYNSALAEYRARNNIRGTMRPMPDLFVSDESIEAPFWLDNLSAGSRRRPTIFRAGAGWILELVSGEQFVFDPRVDALEAADALRKFLTQTNHRISPRALTLTIFLRMLVADHFVHGIGGGRYDQVADQVLARHFKLDPPAFSVTTATLLFPGAASQPRVCLPCVEMQGHRLAHAVLGERKRELVAAIEKLPRRSIERKAAFAQMQRERHEALASSLELKKWERSLRDTQQRFADERVLFDRELFYAVQSRERLVGMIEKYKSVMS